MEAIAKHDFTATAEDELSFRRSQVLKVGSGTLGKRPDHLPPFAVRHLVPMASASVKRRGGVATVTRLFLSRLTDRSRNFLYRCSSSDPSVRPVHSRSEWLQLLLLHTCIHETYAVYDRLSPRLENCCACSPRIYSCMFTTARSDNDN